MHGNTQLACIAILMAVLAWHFRRSCLPVCSTLDRCNHQTRFLAKVGHAGYPSPTRWPGDACSKGIRLIYAVPGSDNGREAGEPTEKDLVKGQSLLQSLFSRLVGLLRLSAACILLLAAAPYLLSSRLGTAVAAAAASRTLPGDVSIQSISLGWTQPVAVHGLSVYEGEAGKSRQLISLQRFSSAEPLHEVVTGKGHLTLTLSNPTIDCSLTDSGNNFRLVEYLAESRLLGLLTGRHGRAAAAAALLEPQDDSSRHAAGTAAAAAAAKLQSHPIDVSDAAAVSEDDAGTAATAGAAGGPQKARGLLRGRHADGAACSSSTSSAATTTPAAAAAVPTPAPAAAGALPANFIQRLTQADASSQVSAELKLPMLSLYIPDGQLLLPKELGAAMGDHIHAVAAAGRSAVQDLADELEEDCSWLQRQQQPQEQPPEAQQQQQDQQQQQQQQQQQDQQHESRQENHQQQQDGSMATAVHSSWPLPPPGITKKAWQRATPLLLQVSGERVSALVRGWHCGSFWRISQSSLLLEQPATAAWEFTPELAALTLSQFNPLLEEVAFIREGGRLMTSIAPEGGKIPAESGQLWVSPVKLVVGKGNLLSQIFRLLGMHGRFGSSGHHHQQPWLSGNSSGSATAAAAAKELEAAAAEGGAAVQGVEVWSGPLRVAMEAPGRFRTDRVDMIVGSGRNTLHLALWGTVDTTTNCLAMTIGLPDTTLAKAGLKNLPPGYMLPVAVGGPLHRPQVEWNAAVRQLAVLSAMQLGREAWQYEAEKVAGALWGAATHNHEGAAAVSTGLAGLFGAANRALSKATSSFIGQVDERLQTVLCGVPPPAELPWETSRPTDTEQPHSHSHSHQQPHKPSDS